MIAAWIFQMMNNSILAAVRTHDVNLVEIEGATALHVATGRSPPRTGGEGTTQLQGLEESFALAGAPSLESQTGVEQTERAVFSAYEDSGFVDERRIHLVAQVDGLGALWRAILGQGDHDALISWTGG